jgi:hypothetical protein
MSLTVRRVVTGHDENGRAIVSINETFKNVVQTRPSAHAWISASSSVISSGRSFPSFHPKIIASSGIRPSSAIFDSCRMNWHALLRWLRKVDDENAREHASILKFNIAVTFKEKKQLIKLIVVGHGVPSPCSLA